MGCQLSIQYSIDNISLCNAPIDGYWSSPINSTGLDNWILFFFFNESDQKDAQFVAVLAQFQNSQ